MSEDYDLETLANGVRIAWKHVPNVPDIATALIFTVGASNAPPGFEQAPHFIEHLFFKPTSKYDTNIPSLIRKITGRPIGNGSAVTFPHAVAVKNRLPATNQEAFFALLYDMVENTNFDPSEVEKERTVMKEEIAPSSRGTLQIWQKAISATLPGFFKPPTAEAIERLTLADLEVFKQQAVNSQNTYLILAGDVTDKTLEVVSGYFGSLRGGGRINPPVPPTAQEVRLFSYSGEGVSTHAFTRLWQGPAIANTDYPILKILLEYIGGSLDSRLGRRLRDELSLVYSMGKDLVEFGPVSIASLGVLSFKPQDFKAISSIIDEELERARAGSFDTQLLSSVKKCPALTFFEEHYETLEKRRGSITEQVVLGRKSDAEFLKQIESFTEADLALVANKYLRPCSTDLLFAPGGQLP